MELAHEIFLEFSARGRISIGLCGLAGCCYSEVAVTTRRGTTGVRGEDDQQGQT